MTNDITTIIDREFETYLPLLEKFQFMPTSLRLFEEVRAESIALLKRYGEKRSDCTNLIGSTRHILLSTTVVHIVSPPKSDYLLIKDYDHTKFELRRQRGYQLLKQIEKMDEVETSIRGPSFREIIRGWRQFQPYSLDLTDLSNGDRKTIQY